MATGAVNLFAPGKDHLHFVLVDFLKLLFAVTLLCPPACHLSVSAAFPKPKTDRQGGIEVPASRQ